MEQPTIICITAMKNEAWIIERFLSCASVWADHIILLDQNSEDNSVELAKKYDKVILKHNDSKEFNDFNHWNTLMEESRKIKAQRKVIFAIDCDEFISANSFDTLEWKNFVYNAKPGSLFVCQRVAISQDFDSYTKEPNFLIGFVDDGYSSINDLGTKKQVHNIRLPYPKNNPDLYKVNKIKLLHYNLTDFKRLVSKMRWYQCFEMTIKDKDVFTIMNQYYSETDFSTFWSNKKSYPIIDAWIAGYESLGIDMTTVINSSNIYWWDYRILEYFNQFGTKLFAKLPIWYFNWEAFAKQNALEIRIERSFFDKVYSKAFIHYKSSKSNTVKTFLKIALKYFS
jgi:hypothetical protein